MRRFLCLLICVAPLLTGCAMLGIGVSGTAVGPKWTGAEPKKVWAATKDAFGIDWRTAYSNDTDYELESEWDTQLAPMYRKGRRRRASVWMHLDDGTPYLEVQILREVNTDRERPMDEGYATWEADGRDVELERKLMRSVELRIGKVHERAEGSGGSRPSPYRDEETQDEKSKRLWGDK